MPGTMNLAAWLWIWKVRGYDHVCSRWSAQKKHANITIEFTFAGINMFWARLRLILARAARLLISLWRGIEKTKTEKNDNKTLWRIFFSPALWENVNKLWNGFSILIGCLDRTIIWFSFFIGLFQRAKMYPKFSILARKMRHNARQCNNNTSYTTRKHLGRPFFLVADYY